MAEQEVHRRLVDGVWRTTVGEEGASGGGDGGDGAEVQVTTVTVPSAWILANQSGSTVYEILPAHPAGIIVLGAAAVLRYGTTPYSGDFADDSDLILTFGTNNNNPLLGVIPQEFWTAEADTPAQFVWSASVSEQTPSSSALSLALSGGLDDPSGDSDVDITVAYIEL